jgi:hypothetical protein
MSKLTDEEDPHRRDMDALLAQAKNHPKHWHEIGADEDHARAAAKLEARGLIEIRQPQNQYRLKA